MVLRMDNGCAGFFSDDDLAHGKGVIHTEQEQEVKKNLEKLSDSFNTIDKEFSDEPRSIEPDSTLKEPLLVMAEDFVNSIENKIEPLSNMVTGMNVVKILSAPQKSIKNSGQEIYI